MTRRTASWPGSAIGTSAVGSREAASRGAHPWVSVAASPGRESGRAISPGVALVSAPAVGAMRIRHRTAQAVVVAVGELYARRCAGTADGPADRGGRQRLRPFRRTVPARTAPGKQVLGSPPLANGRFRSPPASQLRRTLPGLRGVPGRAGRSVQSSCARQGVTAGVARLSHPGDIRRISTSHCYCTGCRTDLGSGLSTFVVFGCGWMET